MLLLYMHCISFGSVADRGLGLVQQTLVALPTRLPGLNLIQKSHAVERAIVAVQPGYVGWAVS